MMDTQQFCQEYERTRDERAINEPIKRERKLFVTSNPNPKPYKREMTAREKYNLSVKITNEWIAKQLLTKQEG
jgi:hypothetical protein